MPLHDLPIELLHYICTFLRPSTHLHSFSLVDRRCHSAAISEIFHSIVLDVANNDETFAKKISAFTSVFESVGAEHIHKIEIGDMTNSRNESHGSRIVSDLSDDSELEHYSSTTSLWHQTSAPVIDDQFDVTIWDHPPPVPRNVALCLWERIARLLEQLPALTDLRWSWPDRVPPCVLSVLSRHSKASTLCRLHLPNFTFGSDVHSAYQYALDITPFLSSVSVCFFRPRDLNERGCPESTLLFLELVVRKTPRLKEIRSYMQSSGMDESRWAIDLEKTRVVLDEMKRSLDNHDDLPLCKLDRLDIKGPWYLDPQYFRQCERYMDLSALRVLRLTSPSDALIEEMTACPPFPCLHTLILTVEYYPFRGPDCYPLLNSFLASFQPLQDLRIYGQYDRSSMLEIMKYHGGCLRRLWLYPNSNNVTALDEELATTMQERCPNLEDLSVEIRRSKGDASEVAIYEALGSMPKLETFHLTVAIDNPYLLTYPDDAEDRPLDPSLDEFDRQYYPGMEQQTNRPTYGHIRDMLINAAIDEKLALSIYAVMSDARRASNGRPLKLLSMNQYGGGQFNYGCSLRGLPECFAEVGRNYRIERTSRDDVGDKVDVICLSDEELEPWRNEFRLQRHIRAIFQRLWPEGKEKKYGDWRQVWHSFPLARRDCNYEG